MIVKCFKSASLQNICNKKNIEESGGCFLHNKNRNCLMIKANHTHNFSDLFDKVHYLFRKGPLSIIRSISTLYTRSRYFS